MKIPLLGLVPLLVVAASAAPVVLHSPAGTIDVTINDEHGLALTLSARSRVLVTQEIGLNVRGQASTDVRIARHSERTGDENVRPLAPVKAKDLRDHYQESTLVLSNGWSLQVRAYDEGAAYRFVGNTAGQIEIESERQVNRWGDGSSVYFGREKDFYSHNEVTFEHVPWEKIEEGALASLPLLVRDESGALLLFSETGLEAYPGQWMRKRDGALEGVWPGYPTAEEETSDRDIKVTSRASFIARTSGQRAFPWRYVAVALHDGDLLLNQLGYLLAEPSRIGDAPWIKAGKVQWDWWHDFNVYDLGIPTVPSQALYKHYIDFAAAHDARYIILDEGWYKLRDLTATERDIDVPALVQYGKGKGVGVILWASWATLKNQFDTVMPLFERWGVAGLKVDFFQRDDQPAVEFYWRLAAEGAKRHLLLDFHGAHKPAGLNRTYPNVLTSEGVKGMENSKWSDFITPEHDVTLPFTRQVCGPMDYTPGAMDNAQKKEFRPLFHRPMSQGTRCHQLAMYVVFESPLQMYADSPTNYRREPKSFEFMQAVPSVWDETRVLVAEVGKVVGLARRSGNRWFVGVLNGSDPRDVTLNLDFLPAGTRLEVWRDGVNAEQEGRSFEAVEMKTGDSRSLVVHLATGGGWVAIAGR